MNKIDKKLLQSHAKYQFLTGGVKQVSDTKIYSNSYFQQRAPGTKLKITQWLVTRLRDPASNPSVITWEEEERGVFRVEDSAMLAKLWGEVKENRKMTYEKLSRAMR